MALTPAPGPYYLPFSFGEIFSGEGDGKAQVGEQDRESATALPDVLLGTVGVVWERLTDQEKTTLHLVATWPGKSIIGTCVEKSAASLATEAGKTLHKDTARAVELLAVSWHREAGRV